MSRTKHGYSSYAVRTGTYVAWVQMRARCNNPRNKDYPCYGGRGISVCELWNDYEAFLSDMGERPVGKTLERNDVDGSYCLLNCRWATLKEQGRNRRTTRFNVSVIDMIRRLSGKLPQKRIAACYKVSQGYVSRIVNREIWA